MAFKCFFKLIFAGKLPDDAQLFLPKSAASLPESSAPTERARAKTLPPTREEQLKPQRPKSVMGGSANEKSGALLLLGLLQREGRLVDFLNESIEAYDDSDIGAAVRDIHRGCKKVLDGHFSMEPVMPGSEDEAVRVPAGFDPGEVRLVGEVSGDPPFNGTLRHHGWRVTKTNLPAVSDEIDRNVLAPAEVELA